MLKLPTAGPPPNLELFPIYHSISRWEYLTLRVLRGLNIRGRITCDSRSGSFEPGAINYMKVIYGLCNVMTSSISGRSGLAKVPYWEPSPCSYSEPNPC